MEWIKGHSEIITALSGVGSLLVWIIYLQVFVRSYRRQLRATLLITRGPGEGLDSRCFLSNMSAGPVYVESVLLRLQTRAGTTSHPVTQRRPPDGGERHEVGRRTRQGPLDSGESRDIGSFREMIEEASTDASFPGDSPEAWLRSVSVEVIGIYGSEDLPVGARRPFTLRHVDGRPCLEAREVRTRQILKRRERRQLVADLERDR